MTPRPARREAPGRNVRPASVTDTDFRAFINGADASRPCAETSDRSVRRANGRFSRRLPGVRAWRLTICSASWISIRLVLWSCNSRNTRSSRNSSSACIVSESVPKDSVVRLAAGARPWNRSWETPSASATCIRRPASGRPDPLAAFGCRLSAEHFGKIVLRKPEREPSCFHKLIDLAVGRFPLIDRSRWFEPGTSGRLSGAILS